MYNTIRNIMNSATDGNCTNCDFFKDVCVLLFMEEIYTYAQEVVAE